MEKNPWYKNVEGPFLQWQGPVGIKADGGGCTRGRGLVGSMVLHRAAHSRDKEGTILLNLELMELDLVREFKRFSRFGNGSDLGLITPHAQRLSRLWTAERM